MSNGGTGPTRIRRHPESTYRRRENDIAGYHISPVGFLFRTLTGALASLAEGRVRATPARCRPLRRCAPRSRFSAVTPLTAVPAVAPLLRSRSSCGRASLAVAPLLRSRCSCGCALLAVAPFLRLRRSCRPSAYSAPMKRMYMRASSRSSSASSTCADSGQTSPNSTVSRTDARSTTNPREIARAGS